MYFFKKKELRSYITELYAKGLQPSTRLDEKRIVELIQKIGIFRFKGYLYAFKNNLRAYSIDDILVVYYFDKFLTRYVMELTSSIETLLKTRLIEICYLQSTNPFFYLLKENHKYTHFRFNKHSLHNWKNIIHQTQKGEEYLHYCIYYRAKYSFETNKDHYIAHKEHILLTKDINYPPFHYFIEGATLGVVIHLIKSLKIGEFDILRAIGKSFGVHNPRTFEPYLERLNEVRNRAAHRERLFNRSYRSVRGVGKFDALRVKGVEHRFGDVYLWLLFLLNHLNDIEDAQAFYTKEVFVLLEEFQADRLIARECFNLNEQLDDRIKTFIKKGILGE